MATIDDNLAGLRDRVRRWLHEVAAANSYFGNSFIDQQINTSYRRRCANLVMANEGYFTNVATRNLVADQERYAWPPGFERLLKMELIRTDNTRVPIERNERHYQINFTDINTSQDSYIPTYRAVSGGFVLEPAPGTSVTNGIRIEYHGLPTQLQNDGDSLHSDFPRSYDELIVLDAVVACMDSRGLLETGNMKTVVRQRSDWEMDFERFIDNRIISTNKVVPFNPHYPDA